MTRPSGTECPAQLAEGLFSNAVCAGAGSAKTICLNGPFTVAIDGPAASGKGTIARALAQHFGFAHLDTGLLYRAVGMAEGDPLAAARALDREPFDPAVLERAELRTEIAAQAASRVAALPAVRAALVALQRRFARRAGGAVLDGRDIGTVICPEAEVKLFVTASAAVRARRRAAELGQEADFPKILAELEARDARDAARPVAPLRPAPDALILDTSNLSITDAVAQAVQVVAQKLAERCRTPQG